MGAVEGGGGDGGKGEDDEADPLDAFMTGLQAPSVTQARTQSTLEQGQKQHSSKNKNNHALPKQKSRMSCFRCVRRDGEFPLRLWPVVFGCGLALLIGAPISSSGLFDSHTLHSRFS